jgi:hypothetical protein
MEDPMKLFRSALLALITLGTPVAPCQDSTASRPTPAIEYRVSCEIAEDPHLRVEVSVRGLLRVRASLKRISSPA